jgi:RNA polymerase sigma-70 factor (ECF subfamily)
MPVRPQQSETPTASPAQMPPEVPLIQASGADFGAETGREDDFGLDPALDPALDDAASPDSPQPSRAPRVSKDMATSVMQPAASLGGSTRPAASYTPGFVSDYTKLEDSEIMLRVRDGDTAGYEYLVQKYRRAMVNYMYRMVRNQAVGEELAQEVFLRVYRSRATYRAEARFSTWLYRIATNLGVNHARDTKLESSASTVYLDAADAETGTRPDVADSTPNIEQDLVRDERMAAIRAQVEALPERQRMAVLMHKYQDLDYREIGRVLKLSESATKSLLFRAYQTLRESLKDFV